MLLLYFLISLISLNFQTNWAYKILVFNPKFSHSQVKFMGNVADIMAEAGHDVTVLLSEMSPIVKINGSKLAKIITIPAHPEVAKFRSDENFIRDGWKQKMTSPFRLLASFSKFTDYSVIACEHILKYDKILELLKNNNFDIALLQLIDPCLLGLTELLKIPTHVAVSSIALFEYYQTIIGVPNIPSYVPALIAPYTDQMSYFERASNLLRFISLQIFTSNWIQKTQKLFRHYYGKNFIDLKEKAAQSAYVITNSDPFYDYPRPLINKVLAVGGFAVPRKHHLDKYWKKIMEQRKKVVLVSFGSVVHSYLMSDTMKQTLLKTFDQFPDITFIWKYEKEEDHIADGHPNVITGTWLPQTDILAHPNLKLFITHGGINSITETLNIGKPVIVVPVISDQVRNANLVKRGGFGELLTVSDVMEEGKLRDTLMLMLNSTRYSEKAEKLKRMIAKRPNPSREQLIKHVEFAAEFGSVTNFDPYGRKLTFFQYYMLDIIIPFLILVLFVMVAVLYIILKFVQVSIKWLCKKNQKSKDD